ncbi:hypothetical protein [Actinomyces bowdenii]|uniref:hypothetical protein n=1 Tax=Actinomyces bowdenii TaxID=131109 RepID=UPI001FB86D62|nr:hypothetical protein [Actinomyces bowdenii]
MNGREKQEIRQRLLQEKVIEESLANGDGPWTVVYDTWGQDSQRGARYVALAQPAIRDKVLSSSTWDLSIGAGTPGFIQRSNSDVEAEYYRIYEAPELEPLIIVQEFHGVAPNATLVSEEFILLMNLWKDPKSGNYFKIGDDGSKDLAIKIDGSKIEIRTPILKKYLAARQLDAILYVDSVVSVPTALSGKEFSGIEIEDRSNGRDECLSRSVGEMPYGHQKVFSRVLVKHVLIAPPQETCGIWPWDELDPLDYPDFVIGEDEIGKPIKFTCDPDQLANYFGANPDAPHYLTPVFFKPEVLQKYYDNSDLYTVSAGRISCGCKWAVDIDNYDSGAVSVFLGDIGRDIPRGDWSHWLAHNVPPTQKMSETNIRLSFLNQSVESPNPEHRFKLSYQNLLGVWNERWGWTLYRDATGSDAGIIKRLRIPLNDTDAELRLQLLNLALVLVDLLNEKALSAEISADKNEKGIAKLRRFLELKGYPQVDRDIKLLQKVQQMRSRIAAHASGSSGAQLLDSELDGKSPREYIARLMSDATQMLNDLTEFSKCK